MNKQKNKIENIIGIDPGFDGAVVIISSSGAGIKIYDTPTIKNKIQQKNKREYAIWDMVNLLRGIKSPICALELVHAMPAQGVRSMWRMGYGYGIWEGILVALRIPYQTITPQRWRKNMLDGLPKGKFASIIRARQLYPTADLRLKKHDGRADALLLAEYLRRLLIAG
jgi:hypothetical protein